ncbi:MAG TPA: 3'-5' exonuclease, partial [Spirochaetota bacterium]|nr:3'-5' exonuclease [Spirochaetota bacterium]
VYDMYLAGKKKEINDYCIHDVLDTYFVFLRTRVMQSELTIEREQDLVKMAKNYIEENQQRIPALQIYLKNWGDWDPWP